MKRSIAFFLIGLVMLTLAGCNNAPSSSIAPVQASSQSQLQVQEPIGYPFTDSATINPLTGLARPESLQAGQRPVAIMVANNQLALPQRGVAKADVVYETVTEGGITRLMAMYADYNLVPTVGPVRSIRDSFIQLAAPSETILAFIGSSVYANNLLNVMEYQGINGLYLGTTAFGFDAQRALTKPREYNWFTDSSLLWNGMERIDINPVGEEQSLFAFADSPVPPATQAEYLQLNYSAASQPTFEYDAAQNVYNKNIFGAPHADEDGTRLSFTNVIALCTNIQLREDNVTVNIDLTKGEGYYFTAGTVEKIHWEKGDPRQPLKLFKEDGTPLFVQRGKSYIGILPLGQESPVIYGQFPAPVETPPAEG